jgi:thiol:disulfide interchange protein DsbC
MLEGKEPPAAAESCKDPIGDVAKLAEELSIQGTPGLIFESGRLVPGAIEAGQIEELLNAPGKS